MIDVPYQFPISDFLYDTQHLLVFQHAELKFITRDLSYSGCCAAPVPHKGAPGWDC